VARDVASIIAEDGPIARQLGAAYEHRPQQAAMARAVAAAMEARSHLVVEAGTGVGKSFAYLVPAILRCVEHGERVVVATNTIALQEQLIEKDVPLLEAALAPPTGQGVRALRPVLVKGRNNYLSIRRLETASKRQDRLFVDARERRSLHVIEDWARTTRDGTLSTLPVLEDPAVWEAARSDADNCMGRNCPYFSKCFYQHSRMEMEGANLLITNHAMFFADLSLRSGAGRILPEYDHVVLDEAHAIEEVASENFGVSLRESAVQHLLGELMRARTGKGLLSQHLGVPGVERVLAQVERCNVAAREFFGGLRELMGGDVARRVEGEAFCRRLCRDDKVGNPLTPALVELSLLIRWLRDQVKNEDDRYDLNSAATRAETFAKEAKVLVERSIPGSAYWVDVGDGRKGARRVTLACAPVEVGPILREHLFKRGCSVVMTSATLATGARDDGSGMPFRHFMERVGCEGAGTLLLGSPFDYARQMEVYIEDAPEEGHESGGMSPVSRAILKHVGATNGGAFVLFTSFQMLHRCAGELRGAMESLGLPLLVQGQDGSRNSLLKRFRENERSVLLGAATFWQGVDVRGQGLRNVIIVRLPFEPPDRPLTQARHELIQARGGSSFQEDSLPRAVLRFKQGIGRLIRSAEDRGRVVILDGRVVSKRYGRAFLAALPRGVRVHCAVGEADDAGR
jgi:ATP-dependent DNA helicase DinG